MEKRPALGKGLSALIPDVPTATPTRAPLEVDVDRLEPSEFQPRLQMEESALDELARSISANGIIQPVVVRKVANDRYQIIAGERRWRAAQRAGLTKVPVVVKDTSAVSRAQLLEWALIENVQRENLNPIEEATAFQRLVHEFNMTHDDIAQRVGKDRSTVANTLRLLKLPAEVRAEVGNRSLSMGHARALVALLNENDQRQLAREVIARGLSVRETESLVKRALEPKSAPPATAPKGKDADTRAAEDQLYRAVGSKVDIVRRGKGGQVVIAFGSEDELQRIFDRLVQAG
jgi:ParB family chromosome partitioning protein